MNVRREYFPRKFQIFFKNSILIRILTIFLVNLLFSNFFLENLGNNIHEEHPEFDRFFQKFMNNDSISSK